MHSIQKNMREEKKKKRGKIVIVYCELSAKRHALIPDTSISAIKCEFKDNINRMNEQEKWSSTKVKLTICFAKERFRIRHPT